MIDVYIQSLTSINNMTIDLQMMMMMMMMMTMIL